MYSYMEHIERQFLEKCGLSPNDSYANFVLSSSSILDFRVPVGQSIQIGAQPSPNVFNTYSFSDLESISGAMSFLYSSVPVPIVPSRLAPLEKLCQRFNEAPEKVETVNRATLMYGQMQLAGQSVEAMAIHKWNPSSQIVAKWVCDPRLARPVILTTTLQRLGPNSTTEFIYSSHENLLGIRALYNMAEWSDSRSSHSRLATGFEIFYAASKKAPGTSMAARYSTFSKYTSTPLTLTTVLNPLMGNISVAYALKPTQYSGLSSRFDFNFYSYESDLNLGCELWRTEPISALVPKGKSGIMSVFKASTSLASQTARFLWETSFKDILVSAGATVCYGDRSFPVQLGLELIYASAPSSATNDAAIATTKTPKNVIGSGNAIEQL